MAKDDNHSVVVVALNGGRVSHAVYGSAEAGTAEPAAHATALDRLHPLPQVRAHVQRPQLLGRVPRPHRPAVHVNLQIQYISSRQL